MKVDKIQKIVKALEDRLAEKTREFDTKLKKVWNEIVAEKEDNLGNKYREKIDELEYLRGYKAALKYALYGKDF